MSARDAAHIQVKQLEPWWFRPQGSAKDIVIVQGRALFWSEDNEPAVIPESGTYIELSSRK